jgi:CRP-like cAMP-binding protein
MTSEPMIEALRELPLFRGASEEALRAVALRSVYRSYPRDTMIFRRGEACRGLFVVIEGRVQVYRSRRDGREQTLHSQGPGQALGEVPLFDGGTYPASARAVEESRLLYLSIDDFQWLYRMHPELADSIIRELGRRLRRMVGLVEKISLRDVPARVALTLLEHAESAEIVAAPEAGAQFDLRRTHDQLATELATTRESISRALNRLEREGVIRRQGSRVIVPDLAMLERASTSI